MKLLHRPLTRLAHLTPHLTLLLGATLPAQAQMSTTCSADTRFRNDSGQTTQVGTGISNGQSCVSTLNGGGIGVATANAVAGQGFLKVDTHADTLSQPNVYPWQSAHAQATAGLLDRLVISAPGQNNKFGVMSFSVTLSGFMSSAVASSHAESGENRGYWSLTAGLRPAFFNNPDDGIFESIGPSWSFNSPMPLRGSFQQGWNLTLTGQSAFRFNAETRMVMDLALITQALFPGSTVDGFFGNSAYWGGITSIKDSNGVVLTAASGPAQAGQYSMVTQSGFDWHPSRVPSPVPEPAAAWLMLLGLPLLRAARALANARSARKAAPAGPLATAMLPVRAMTNPRR